MGIGVSDLVLVTIEIAFCYFCRWCLMGIFLVCKQYFCCRLDSRYSSFTLCCDGPNASVW
jgi:hypothetical protein